MLGKLTPPEIENLLQRAYMGRIGCGMEEEVYVVPILYAYDGKFIYGHSKEGKKIQLMRKQPRVCFEVDEVRDIGNWQSVILQANFEELLGEEQRKAMAYFLHNLLSRMENPAQNSSYGMADFHQKEQDGVKTVIFRLRVREKSGRFERQRR